MNMCVCLTEVSIKYCSSVAIQLLGLILRCFSLSCSSSSGQGDWLVRTRDLCVSLFPALRLQVSTIVSSFMWVPSTLELRAHKHIAIRVSSPATSWAFEVLLIHAEKDTEMNVCDGKNLKMPVGFYGWGRWTSRVLGVIKSSLKLPDSTVCPPERGMQGRISDRIFCGQGDIRQCGHSDFL